MYNLIRIIIVILTTIIFYIGFVRRGKLRLRTVLICSLIAYLLIGFIPFENLLGFRFTTPAEAFLYKNTGEICEVIEGAESAVIVTYKKGVVYTLIPKDKNGWLLDYTTPQEVQHQSTAGYSLTTFRSRNNNECIIIVTSSSRNDIIITDNRGTEFKKFVIPPNDLVKYFGIIKAPDQNYEIIINGEKVTVDLNLITSKA
jgi:hypothetical protein